MAGMGSEMGPPDSYFECQDNCSNPFPLTTTFTPPTSCFNYWTPVSTLEANSPNVISFTQNSTRDECALSKFSSYVTSCLDNCGVWPSISPGICPSGWSAASIGIANNVTTKYCCPSDAGQYTSSEIQPTAQCYGTITNSLMSITYNTTWNLVPNTTIDTETTQTIFVYTGYLAASAIVVQLKDNDFPSSVTPASTTSVNSSMLIPSKGSTTGLSTTGPTSSVVSSPSTKQGGLLSSGAKAGMGVGVALGVCAIVALSFFIYHLRKRRITGDRSTSGVGAPELNNQPMETKELSHNAMKARELPDSSRRELYG